MRLGDTTHHRGGRHRPVRQEAVNALDSAIKFDRLTATFRAGRTRAGAVIGMHSCTAASMTPASASRTTSAAEAIFGAFTQSRWVDDDARPAAPASGLTIASQLVAMMGARRGRRERARRRQRVRLHRRLPGRRRPAGAGRSALTSPRAPAAADRPRRAARRSPPGTPRQRSASPAGSGAAPRSRGGARLSSTTTRTRRPAGTSASGQCRHAAGFDGRHRASGAEREVVDGAERAGARVEEERAAVRLVVLDDVAGRVDEDALVVVAVVQPRQEARQLVHEAVDHPHLAPRGLEDEAHAAGAAARTPVGPAAVGECVE